jgi:hypothetical protein
MSEATLTVYASSSLIRRRYTPTIEEEAYFGDLILGIPKALSEPSQRGHFPEVGFGNDELKMRGFSS